MRCNPSFDRLIRRNQPSPTSINQLDMHPASHHRLELTALQDTMSDEQAPQLNGAADVSNVNDTPAVVAETNGPTEAQPFSWL
jgi:hypothetical protein